MKQFLEHNYENAHYDCKLVLDGIDSDETFQKADSGIVLSYLPTIVKSLEKQTPKKPILKSGQSVVHVNRGDKPHEMRVDKWQEWCCPVCGWFVGQRYNKPNGQPHDQRKSNYCNECGQHIDWSNE